MMTFPRNLVLASLVPLFLLVPAGAHAAPTNALSVLKSAYDNDRLALGMTTEQRRQDSLKQYGKSLDGLLAALKKKGDLENYLVVDTERKRFASEGNVADASASIPALTNAVQTYRRTVAVVGAESDRQAGVLLTRYAASLDALIKQLTQADKIADAKQVMIARKAIEAELTESKSKLSQTTKPASASDPKAAMGPGKSDRRLLSPATLGSVVRPQRSLPTSPRGINGLEWLNYSFDTKEEKKVTDQSTRHSDGEVHGATWVAGRKTGGAYWFDGLSSYIETPWSGFPVESICVITISAWVYPLEDCAGRVIVEICSQDGNSRLMLSEGPASSGQAVFSVKIGETRVEAAGSLKPRTWQMLTGTWGDPVRDGPPLIRPVRLYVDGRSVAMSTWRVNDDLMNAKSVTIGCGDASMENAAQNRHFKGLMDDVMVLDWLSDEQVEKLYDFQAQ